MQADSMHDVEALIAKSEKLTAGVRPFQNAIVCPLVQGFSLLPITEALAKELTVYQSETQTPPTKPIREFSDGLHALAIEISHAAPVAYIHDFLFWRPRGAGGAGLGQRQLTLLTDHARL
jgi:hypothetical protein